METKLDYIKGDFFVAAHEVTYHDPDPDSHDLELADLRAFQFYEALGEAVTHNKDVQMVVAGFSPDYEETIDFLKDTGAKFVLTHNDFWVIETQRAQQVTIHIMSRPHRVNFAPTRPCTCN